MLSSCLRDGTNVLSCKISGIVSAAPGMTPSEISFFSVSSEIR